MEREHLLGEPIRNLSTFVARCNAALGRSAVMTAGSDGLISAVDLTQGELGAIRKINDGTYGIEAMDDINIRGMTAAQIDVYIEASLRDLEDVRAFLKRLAKLVALTYRAFEG